MRHTVNDLFSHLSFILDDKFTFYVSCSWFFLSLPSTFGSQIIFQIKTRFVSLFNIFFSGC